MEWLLLVPAAAMLLLCVPIAGKIEDFFMAEEHIHPEFYTEESRQRCQKEQEGGKQDE